MQVKYIPDIRGCGVFTQKRLKQGDYVCPYNGILLTEDEAELKEKEYALWPQKDAYMFWYTYMGKTMW